MTDTHSKHPESIGPEMTKIATTPQQAYPESVSKEVTKLLSNLDQLPQFSQQTVRKVIAALPSATVHNMAQVKIANNGILKTFNVANDDTYTLKAQA